jgi:hypothetical protein
MLELEQCSKRLLATEGPSYGFAALLDFAVGYASRVGSRLAIWKDRGNKAPLEQPVGSFFGILILSYIDHVMVVDKSDLVMIVGESCCPLHI